MLESDHQELFRRAQLRQVLVYLRDADFLRYIQNIQQLLASRHIRPHLKLLVLELVANFPDSRDEEFNVLLPYLTSEFASLQIGVQNSDRIASRALEAFFGSRTLFVVADRLGYIMNWLKSRENSQSDLMTRYLLMRAESYGDRVAELLEPFVGKEGSWSDRLRSFMEWVGVHLGKSRRLFDLFLRLLDDGTLDKARAPIAVNSTFWSILYSLADDQPTWYAEVAAHWLNRQVTIAQALIPEGHESILRLDDQFGVENLIKCAAAVPQSVLEHVLPAVLHASESFMYSTHDGLIRDRIWTIRFRFEHISLSEAYLTSCEKAIEQIGTANPESLRPLVASLRESRLYIANNFLLPAFRSAPEIFADESMALLADEPERFHCGFSNSSFWSTRNLIEKCSALCSEDNFLKIELAILSFTTPYERSADGLQHRGSSAYELASALALNRCSSEARIQIAEWQMKFGASPRLSLVNEYFGPVSPIPKEVAQDMSDEQWLEAISMYNKEGSRFDIGHSKRGGASELAELFREFVKKDPDRFARLALRFPKDTNSSYVMNVLYGMKQEAVDPQLKLEVSRLEFNSNQTVCLMAALDLLGTIVGFHLPEDAILFIQKMATEHPDPEPNDSKEGDLLFRGFNSVRCHGLEAICELIFYDIAYLKEFEHTFELCIHDRNLAVRACAVNTIFAVMVHDPAKAIVLFKKLLEHDNNLLAAPSVERFLAEGLRQHPGDLIVIVERMLLSDTEGAMQAGGRLACLARLYHPSLDYLSEQALTGKLGCRIGAAEVASQNLVLPSCRSWCEPALLRLFNDEDESVRRNAAHCFWYLCHQPELQLADFDALISYFLFSQSFAEEPTFLLNALDNTRQRVPKTILDVCETFVAKCSEQARDIRTAIAGDEMLAGKLVFRAYAQLEAQPLRNRALNLIDEMCAEGLQSAGQHLTEFDR